MTRSSWDPDLDLDLGTGVLRNLLGTTDPAALARAEADIAALQLTRLAAAPVEGGFDLGPLRTLLDQLPA